MSFLDIHNNHIYSEFLDKDFCEEAKDFVYKNKDKFTENPWRCKVKTSRNVTQNILNAKPLHNIKMHISSHIENYMRLTNEWYLGYIDSSWINIYNEGDYQEFHNHANKLKHWICGVLYLSEENSEIEFGLEKRISVNPSFSQLLIFPDFLYHRVLHSQKNKIRVSLAFNFLKCDTEDLYEF